MIPSISPPTGYAWVLFATLLTSSGDAGLAVAGEPQQLEEAGRIESFSGDVFAVRFTPDGKYLVTTSYRDPLQVFDANTRERVAQIGELRNTFYDSIREVAISPDGTRIVFGEYTRADDGHDRRSLRFADVPSFKISKTLDFEFGEFAFTPKGDQLATALRTSVSVIDITSYKTVRQIGDGHPGLVWYNSMAFDTTGKHLALSYPSIRPHTIGPGAHTYFAYPDAGIEIWDTASGKQVRRFEQKGGKGANTLAFLPKTTILAAGHNDGNVYLWDIVAWKHVATFSQSGARVISLALSPDGKLLTAGSDNGVLSLWEFATRTLLAKVDGERDVGPITALEFSPDGRFLAAGGSAKKVVLYKVSELAKR